MLQEVESTAATYLKSVPSFKPFPSHATDRKRDSYTRTFMRVRHVEEVAHRYSMELRSLQGTRASISGFHDCALQTQKNVEKVVANYHVFTAALSVLNCEHYRLLEATFIARVGSAVNACENTRMFDVPRAEIDATIQKRISRIRDALGDTCAAAERLLAWLESRGAVHVESTAMAAA